MKETYRDLTFSLLLTGFFVATLLVSISSAVPNTISSHVRNKRWLVDCPIDGCKGQKGRRGSIGPLGPQGYAGPHGPPGYCDPNFCFQYIKDHLPTSPPPVVNDPIPGEKGEKGCIGTPGNDGGAGLPGLPGAPGEIGMKGDTGETGMKGDQGESGMKGFPGPPGVEGSPGANGETGESGRKGMPGGDGLPGQDGTPGRTGPPGKAGTPGMKGVPGINGEKGEDGMKGEQGLPGPPIDVIPIDAEPCTLALQGVIRFDPILNRLYFCNGSVWMCILTGDCGGPPKCDSPFGPQEIGEQWYQIFVSNVTRSSQDAADIVLVVDESTSMIEEQMWLLIMVPFLERVLTEAGVGDQAVRNRYCLVGFGGFGLLRAGHFRDVNGMACYSAADFIQAQSQLVTSGIMEDGWQAIKFSLDNVPFRNNPFIARNILLITDEGRVEIPEGVGITRQSIEEELRAHDALLNVIVAANYSLSDDPDARVIGVDGDGVSYVLQPNGDFSTSTSAFSVVDPDTNTNETYVDLALSLGGASWALRILRESRVDVNQDLQDSFTSALGQIKLREIIASIERCRRCTCVLGADGKAVSDCVVATDDLFCRCVVANQGDTTQCVRSV